MASTDENQERAELYAVLNSALFRKAPNQSRLLAYLGERHFKGLTEPIKEHEIAVEALNRKENFDERDNSIVRVEAHRLRKRLKHYYDTEGRHHALRVGIDAGAYIARFVADESAATSSPSELPNPQLEHESVVPASSRGVGTRPRAWVFVAVLVALAILFTTVLVWIPRWRSERALAAQVPADTGAEIGQDAAGGSAVRILAGFTRPLHVDYLGQTWLGDRWFSGGEPSGAPREFLSRNADPTLYRQCRVGNFSYSIPLKPGIYELHLYFGPGIQRWGIGEQSSGSYPIVFGINGAEQLINLDFAADGSAVLEPDIRQFKDVSPAADGQLHLSFRTAGQYAFVNAIEVLPGIRGRLRPIRLTTRNYSYTDNEGRIWPPDRFYRGGTTVERRDNVEGGKDAGLFTTERYGNFDYLIPVAPGTYKVTLGFAEMWFGEKLPGGGGAGSRLFNIACNGVILARNFDVYRTAGGSARALVRTFHGLRPDENGRLRLMFTALRNNATLNYLEVEDESK